MKKLSLMTIVMAVLMFSVLSCKQKAKEEVTEEQLIGIEMKNRLAKYFDVELVSDLSVLTENERKMLPFLFEVADIMDELFWLNAFGDKNELLSKTNDEALIKFLNINYGPWDRLANNEAFVEGWVEKPGGANFYPADMTPEEFDALEDERKTSLYTLIRRDDEGKLKVVPFHVEYKDKLAKAHELLNKAAEYAEDEGLKNYLLKVADAMISDEYFESDMAWLDMKTNKIDFVTGAIETYEDGLYGYKASYQAYILIKDNEWSAKLDRYMKFLPELQSSLPVDPKYKRERPGIDGELNVYDVIYYTGHCNAGSKSIAINLPNDPRVHLKKGSRKLQLKNAMKAKFDNILIPIADVLIDEGQRKFISFDAFFTNVMFHEVGHGLGIKYLINDRKTEVKASLKDAATSIEEAKADILGLYMITYLHNKGELSDVTLEEYYITFVASMFRSIRFGRASAHGKANMMRFNYFFDNAVLIRDEEKGTYFVDMVEMKRAINELSQEILIIQGDGDYKKATNWIDKEALVRPELQKDLDRLEKSNIPVDIHFNQGKKILGL